MIDSGLRLCLDAAYADKLHMLVIRESGEHIGLFLEMHAHSAFPPTTYK